MPSGSLSLGVPTDAEALAARPALDRAGYAAAIAAAWRQSLESVLEAGRQLVAAKAALAHGEFEAMVEGDLPFGPRSARMLMAVAKDPRLSDRNHGSALPASWRTLYELSKLDGDSFQAALAAGTIKPDMERKEARALRRGDRRLERLARAEELAAAPVPLEHIVAGGRRYAVLYADPAWEHKTWSEAGKEKSQENHYPTMTQAELLALPVGDLAAPSAALFLWTTGGHLANALALMAAWGFDYRAHQVWLKTNADGTPKRITGYWFIAVHELLLLGVRGDMPAPVMGTQAESVIAEPWTGKHSEKPARFRELIEETFPGVAKLELFCRGAPAPGWDGWGNECDSSGAPAPSHRPCGPSRPAL